MLAIILATIGVAAAVYEWIAVRTRRVPTITAMVKATGWPARIVITAVAALVLVDHFVIGLVL